MSDSHANGPERPDVRISDADREAVAERLRSAAADGRIQLTELDGRVEAAYQAKTAADLDAVTADLPATVPDDRPLRLETKSGSRSKTGRWIVPSQIIADSTSGSITFDFTEAECTHRQVTMQANVRSGSVVLILPVGWGVNMDDVAVESGSVRNKAAELAAPGKPMIVVHGSAKSGTIKARYPRRTFWQWLLRRPRAR